MAVFNATDEEIETILFDETKPVEEIAKKSTCPVIRYTPAVRVIDPALDGVILGITND